MKRGPEHIIHSITYFLIPLSNLAELFRISMGVDKGFDSWNNSQDNEKSTSLTMPGHTLSETRQILVQVLEQSLLIYLPLSRKELIYAGEFYKIMEAYHLFEVPTHF